MTTKSSLAEKLAPLARAVNPIPTELLRQIPYFEEVFKDKELWPILTKLSGSDGIAHIELKKFKNGEKIISEGQFDQMIYWVLRGSANVIAKIKNQSKIIHKSEIGECIGELGVLRGTPRTTDVVAGSKGATTIEIDWAITDKSPELGQYFFHLLTLQMADKLERSYSKHVKIITNAMSMINERTSSLLEKNRQLLATIKKHGINFDIQDDIDEEQALSLAISNIKESLDLLREQESHNTLKNLGTWFEIKLPKDKS